MDSRLSGVPGLRPNESIESLDNIWVEVTRGVPFADREVAVYWQEL